MQVNVNVPPMTHLDAVQYLARGFSVLSEETVNGSKNDAEFLKRIRRLKSTPEEVKRWLVSGSARMNCSRLVLKKGIHEPKDLRLRHRAGVWRVTSVVLGLQLTPMLNIIKHLEGCGISKRTKRNTRRRSSKCFCFVLGMPFALSM
jgi:hypothetical protein